MGTITSFRMGDNSSELGNNLYKMGETLSSEKTVNELAYAITIWYEFYQTANKDETTISKIPSK